jgi:hypothetical protein
LNRSLLSLCSTVLIGLAAAPFASAQGADQVSLKAGDGVPIEQGIRWVPFEGDGNIFITNDSGQNVFQTDPDANQHQLYADIDDSFIKDGQPTREVWVAVEYLDAGTDTLALQYDSGPDGIPTAFKTAQVIQKLDSGEFRSAVIHLTDASFNNRQQGVADLRIDDRGDGADSISQIIVSKTALKLPNSGTVSGTFTDAVSNAGVANAVIRADNGLTAVTGADGAFSLDLHEGSYTLQITRPSYLKPDPQPVTVTAGGTTPLNLALQPFGKDAVTFTAGADAPAEDGLVGLPAEGDGFFQTETKNGEPPVRTGPDTDPFPDAFLYLKVDDNFLFDGQPTREVWIAMEYFDEGTAPFSIHYDSIDNPYAGGATGMRTNSGTWKTYVWHLKDIQFAGRENGGADFRIFDNGGGDANDLYVRKVTVSTKPPANFGILTGTVTNATSGAVIADATVKTDDGESALTDAAGKFTLQIPEGSHTLTVTGFGYTTLTVPNVTVTAGQSTAAPAIALTPTVVRTSVSLGVKSGSVDAQGIRWVQNGEDTDGYGTVTTWEGREVIQTGPSAEPFIDRFLYGEVDDTFLFNGKPTREVWLTVEYWDNGTTPVRLDYDAASEPFKSAETVNRTDTGAWTSYTWHLTDANFANREQNTADFRIFDGSDIDDENDLYVSKVTVSTVNPDPNAGKPGDVNADTQVDVSDAVLVLKSIVGQETLTDPQKAAADVDQSSAVDVADAVAILRIVVGLP